MTDIGNALRSLLGWLATTQTPQPGAPPTPQEMVALGGWSPQDIQAIQARRAAIHSAPNYSAAWSASFGNDPSAQALGEALLLLGVPGPRIGALDDLYRLAYAEDVAGMGSVYQKVWDSIAGLYGPAAATVFVNQLRQVLERNLRNQPAPGGGGGRYM